MKTIPVVLLGLMLLTSLIGISYASPMVQPSGDTCNPNSPNYNAGDCGAHGGYDPPQHTCFVGRNAPDKFCCLDSNTPHGFETSDIQPDVACLVP